MYGCLPWMPFFDSLVKCSLSIASNQSHFFFNPLPPVFIIYAHFSVCTTGRGFILVVFNRISFSAAFIGFSSPSPKQQADQVSSHDCIAEVSHYCRMGSCALSRCLAGEAKDSDSCTTAEAVPVLLLCQGWHWAAGTCLPLTKLGWQQLPIPVPSNLAVQAAACPGCTCWPQCTTRRGKSSLVSKHSSALKTFHLSFSSTMRRSQHTCPTCPTVPGRD